jgi:hypothetical protein
MVMRDNEDIESESNKSNYKDMPPFEDYTVDKVTYKLKMRPWL